MRKVRGDGTICWKGGHLFVSEVLRKEPVGLFETAEDTFEVRYGPILLGHIDHHDRMHRIKAKKRNRKPSPM